MSIRTASGYVAITSAIIVSLLLMAISFALSFSSFFGRFNIFDSQMKDISYALAEACAEKALSNIAQSSSYAGNETVVVETPDSVCDILPVETLGSQKIIKARADFRKAITNIKVIANMPGPQIVSWEEVSSF